MRFAPGPHARERKTERQKRWRMRRRIASGGESSRQRRNASQSVDALPQNEGDFPGVLLSRRPTGADKAIASECLPCEVEFSSYAEAEVHVLVHHQPQHECSESVCGSARMQQIERYFNDPLYARRFRV